MTYTSILFALSFDKFFFGTVPGWPSIIGSTLIIGSAIVMAMQRVDAPKDEETAVAVDEEQGLMSESDGEGIVQEDRMPIQEVQMRTLR